MKNKLNYYYAGSLCLLFFVILGYISKFYETTLLALDIPITDFFIQLRSTNLTKLLVPITHLGSFPWVTLMTLLFIGFFWYKKERIEAIFIFLAAIIGGGLPLLLKPVFQRPRPSVEHLVTVSSFSFPSAHAFSSMLFYGALIVCIGAIIKKKPWLITIRIILSLIIFSIGISRIYVGVHYFTDVLAGYLLGLSILLASYPLYLKQRVIYAFSKV